MTVPSRPRALVFVSGLALATVVACSPTPPETSSTEAPSEAPPPGGSEGGAERGPESSGSGAAGNAADLVVEADAPGSGQAPEEPIPVEPAVVVPEGGADVACGTPPPGMVCVPGGWFVRGVDEDPHRCDQADQPRDGRSSSVPSARIWVDTFYIDRTEVTNEAYQTCVVAGECVQAGPLYRDFDAPQQPITGMTWFEARDYCAARGQRLPTDAEFEAASRGPDGDWYPWGTEEPTCERAVIMDERGRSCGVEKRGSHPESGRVFEVCSRPEGRYGTCDLVGNAEEWVADWWTADWEECGADCAGANPRGPCDGADECPGHRTRSIRGGSWYWPAEHATGWHRRRYEPENDPPHHFGFRCAVSAADAAPR